jgi:PIN domain nuclease of toxin-antitoxin system
MGAVVADTHAAIWYLLEPEKLSSVARSALREATAAGSPIYLSSISIVEVCYLVEKGKIPAAVLERLNQALAENGDISLELVPLDLTIAQAISQIPRDKVPDMPDRIIAATAFVLKAPLVSRDRKIQTATIQTIW